VNHADVQRQMADYLEGDLPLPRRALFDAHLDACPECRHEVDAVRRTVALLRELPDPEPPPALAADVMRRIRAGEGRAPWYLRAGAFLADSLVPRVAVPATAVAAGLAVAVVSGELDLTLPGVDLDSGGQPVTHRAAAEAQRPPVPRRQAASPAPARERLAGLLTAPPRAEAAAPDAPSEITVRVRPRPPRPDRADGTHGISVSGEAPVVGVLASASARLTTSQRIPPVMVEVGGRGPIRPTAPGFAAASAAGADDAVGSGEDRTTRDRQLSQIDPRIELLLRDPGAFAAAFVRQSGAARDLWVAPLVERILERDLQDQVRRALHDAGDPELERVFAEALAAAEPNASR